MGDIINKEVSITAWYFHGNRQFKSFPRRMEYDNQVYTFADGLRYLITKGQQAIQFFDMTAGNCRYRLRFDDRQGSWTLISITTTDA